MSCRPGGALPVTAPQLVAAMTARGVKFRVVGDRLRVDAPAGELTEADWGTLAAEKPALLALLGDDGAPPGVLAETQSPDSGLTLDAVLRVFPGARVVSPEEVADDTTPTAGHPYGPTAPTGA